jgi:hypothetical protein
MKIQMVHLVSNMQYACMEIFWQFVVFNLDRYFVKTK